MSKKEILQAINPKKKYTLWIYLIILIFLVIAAGVLYFILNSPTKITYKTTKPSIGSITQTISATGTLSATNNIAIGSQISGTIYKVYVDVNDMVKKDQVLAEINPNKLKQTLEGYQAQLNSNLAQLQSSKVTLEQKEWNYQRLKKLYQATKGQSPSQLELQNAKIEFLQAQADVKIKQAALQQVESNINSAKIDLQNSIITSPVDGIILTREISVGQTVAANFNAPTLFTMAENLQDMKLVVNISESDIGKVKENQKVAFSVDAYPDETFYAKVDKINFASTTTDNITSYETSIFVNNDELLLRPGMSATANIEVASAQNAMLIPIAAIFYNPTPNQKNTKKKNSSFLAPSAPPKRERSINNAQTLKGKKSSIYILENNQPKKIDIVLGVTNSNFAQVISNNITKNTLVITDSIAQ